MNDYGKLNGCRVILTTKKDSKYNGKLWCRSNGIFLTELNILNKDGSLKAIPKNGETRMFNVSSIKNISEL